MDSTITLIILLALWLGLIAMLILDNFFASGE